jgi:hypothetical protein
VVGQRELVTILIGQRVESFSKTSNSLGEKAGMIGGKGFESAKVKVLNRKISPKGSKHWH